MAYSQVHPEEQGLIFRLTALSLAYLEQPNHARSALLGGKRDPSSDKNEMETDASKK